MHIHTHVHIHMFIYVYIYMHVHIHAYRHTYILRDAMSKFRMQAAIVAASNAAPLFAARLFAERVPPPRDLARCELAAMHGAIHWPNNSASLATLVHLFCIGAPKFRSATPVAHATALGFAIKRESCIADSRKVALAAALGSISLQHILREGLTPRNWDNGCCADFSFGG